MILEVGVIASVIPCALLLLRWYIAGGVCRCKARLDGKTVIVTGANTGIGKVTASELARRGARVILACRNMSAAYEAEKEIKSTVGFSAQVVVRELDLSDLDSVRRFASSFLEEEERLDVLVNNAGVMRCPKMQSKQGYELQFAVNHLGNFLLTMLLLPALRKSTPSRVINLSSLGHKRGRIDFDDLNAGKHYDPRQVYCNSKLCNVLFTRELASRLAGSGVSAYAVHPGIIRTDLGRHMMKKYSKVTLTLFLYPLSRLVLKSPWEGSQTTLHCVLAEGLRSGDYFSDCNPKPCAPQGNDKEAAKRLWAVSSKLCNLDDEESLQ